MLLSDKPINSADDDSLGFSSFADALAASLTEMAPDEGIVISIEGDWGTGKTSAIQLTERRIIIRELAKERKEPLEDVEVKGWESISKFGKTSSIPAKRISYASIRGILVGRKI